MEDVCLCKSLFLSSGVALGVKWAECGKRNGKEKIKEGKKMDEKGMKSEKDGGKGSIRVK